MINKYKNGKIRYDLLPIVAKENTERVDILIVIPASGKERSSFQRLVYESFYIAAARVKDLSIHICYVELSDRCDHATIYNDSYVYMPWSNPFNKCLAMNLGVIYGPHAGHYLFHDSDLLVPENFFEEIIGSDANSRADYIELKYPVQCFRERRVLYLTWEFTAELIRGEWELKDLEFDPDSRHIDHAGKPGAPGGSILVPKDLFMKVGGYDPELFEGHNVEDQFFFDKLSLFEQVRTLENVELLHLHHGRVNCGQSGVPFLNNKQLEEYVRMKEIGFADQVSALRPSKVVDVLKRTI